MKEELVITEQVDKELKKIGTFWEVKIAEYYNQQKDLVIIFIIKSDTRKFWKIGKNDKVVNIFFCEDFELEEIIKMFS